MTKCHHEMIIQLLVWKLNQGNIQGFFWGCRFLVQRSVERQLLVSFHTSKKQVPPPAAGCFTRECVLL